MKFKIFIFFALTTLSFAGKYHPVIDYIFPLPESKLHSVHVTVILKLDESFLNQINNLDNLIEVTTPSGVHAGDIFFATDDRTIIFKPNSPFRRDEKIDVVVRTSQFDNSEDFAFSFYTAARSNNDLDWLNKTNAATNSSTSDVQNLAPVRLINGVAVPSDFPEINVNILGETAPGRIFTTTNDWLIILNNDGTPYFYRKYDNDYRKMRFEAHPAGVLSFHSFEVYDVILDENYVEIDTVRPGHGYMPDDHELQILENGHKLLVARDHVRIDMSKIVSGGNSNATVEAHHVQELDQDQNVIFEWRNWDHMDIRETDVSLRGGFVDFVHTNSIAVDYDGHLIISPREYNMIMKIDRLTSETIWKLGGNNSDFEFINDNIEFSRIHDVRPVPGKPNHYTLFDNGRDRSSGGQFSRGVEYKLDPDAMTAEKVWEYRHNPDIFSSYCGGLQPLENGNRFISWANHDYFTEVNADEELVYEMHVSGFSCSRSRRDEWDGMMLHPYLILENMGSIIRLIFNKFGDPTVDFYNVYAGNNSNSLAFFDSTKQTYYDIDASTLGNGAQYFFRVTAVDDQGQESDFSRLRNAIIRIIEPGENAITDGDFQSSDAWELHTSSGAQATGQVNAEGYYQISINAPGSNLDDVQLRQNNIMLMQNKDYVFEFDAYATGNRAIGAKIVSTDSRQENYGKIANTAISTRVRRYRYEFPMRFPTDTNARVVFECGGSGGEVFINNVSLTYQDVDDELLPLANPWQNRDIGSPAAPGKAGMLGEKFLIRGSGNDIWNQSDAFHYVYQEVEGDADISARVYSLEETDPWSKAGVMMRNSLQASSRHAMMIMSPGNGAAFQRRVQDEGASTHTEGSGAQAPHWVRLVRKGNRFLGYESVDGVSWDLVDSETIQMNNKIFIGLPVTSHNDGVVCEAQIDNVMLNGETTLADTGQATPANIELHPAFPNPFNPETTIRYALPADSNVSIVVYDVQGRSVRTLVDQRIKAGLHSVVWDGTNEAGESVASGLYIYRIQAQEFSAVRKMTLLR